MRIVVWACLSIAALLLSETAFAVATYDESRRASTVIGKWLSQATSHYDFLSASPLGPRRPGKTFFTNVLDPQPSSDYGLSYMNVPYNSDVIAAYETLGIDTSGLANGLELPRFNVAWGLYNTFDFSASAISSNELTGWGLGFKTVLWQRERFFLSYQGSYGHAEKSDYFTCESISNDLMASYYHSIYDLSVGIRHTSGSIEFKSSIPQLQLPKINYASDLSELEYFYGVTIAATTNTRVTLQMNQTQKESWISGKLSFHFDSLIPTGGNWFENPGRMRY